MVPKQRVVTEYQENRWMETVPREVKTVDYMAVEHVRQWVPEVTQESVLETIPIERTIQRTEYIPVERYSVSVTIGKSFILPPAKSPAQPPSTPPPLRSPKPPPATLATVWFLQSQAVTAQPLPTLPATPAQRTLRLWERVTARLRMRRRGTRIMGLRGTQRRAIQLHRRRDMERRATRRRSRGMVGRRRRLRRVAIRRGRLALDMGRLREGMVRQREGMELILADTVRRLEDTAEQTPATAQQAMAPPATAPATTPPPTEPPPP